METIINIEETVDKFLSEMAHEFHFDTETYPHVRSICNSILRTKYKIGPEGGGFVQALLNNDLLGSYSRCDHINQKYIPLYVKLITHH